MDAITTGQALPLSASIVAGDSNTITITAEGLLAGTVMLRSTSTVTLRAGQTLHLPLVLSPDCTTATPCAVSGDALAEFSTLPAPTTPRRCEMCVPAPDPAEVCNRVDDDCDGTIDEGAGCPDLVESYSTVIVTGVEPFVDACTAIGMRRGVVLQDGNTNRDNDENEVLIPESILAELQNGNFEFDYFGQNVSNVWVGDNGYIAFGPTPPRSVAPARPSPLDTESAPRPGVAVFWDQLQTRDGVCVTLQDSPVGARRLLITWKNACFTPCGSDDSLNFTIALEEDSSRVLLLYGEMTAGDPARAAGSGATAGITRADERCDLSQCEEGLCTSGPNAGLACGDIQLFSQQAQPRLEFVEFEPEVAQ